MRKFLLLPHIKIQNANALSSPYTIGVPAITSWLGFVHALQRKINREDGFVNVKLKGTAVSVHKHTLHTYGKYDKTIIGVRLPIKQNGKPHSFIEEARINLEVSILIEIEGFKKDDEEILIENLNNEIMRMKIAGGDIEEFINPEYHLMDDEKDLLRIKRRLMPGYLLIERRDLMISAMESGMDALDAMLEYLKVFHSCNKDANDNVSWSSKRKTDGWIVPIALGFQGITDLGLAENQRDETTLHRFAESIVTLGEYIMAFRIKNIDEILWEYKIDINNNLYFCKQTNSSNF